MYRDNDYLFKYLVIPTMVLLVILLYWPNIGASDDVVLEWFRLFPPRRGPISDQVYSFNKYDNNVIFCGEWNLPGENGRNHPYKSHLMIGEYSYVEDDIIRIYHYGDTIHGAIAYHILQYDAGFRLIGSVVDTLPIYPWTPTNISVLYLDNNMDSLDYLEINCEQGGAISYSAKYSFLNDDGSIYLFLIYWGALDEDREIMQLNRIDSDRRTVTNLRTYYEDNDFGAKHLSNIKIIRLSDGDFIMTGNYDIERYYNYVYSGGRAPCTIRLGQDGDIQWMQTHLDSVWAGNRYRFNREGNMNCALEHSSGCIYTTGTSEILTENDNDEDSWGILLYKYAPNGSLLWRKYYLDNYRTNQHDTHFNHLIELSPSRLAVFGRISYLPEDERDPGLYVAMLDTTGRILYSTFIRNENIDNEFDDFESIYQIEQTRIFAKLDIYNSLVSIRFDFDPANIIWEPIVSQPNSVNLLPSYPNPFNASSRVTFSLPSASEVRLTLSDMQGRTVSELLNGQMLPGLHQVQLNGSDLPAGVYIIRLESVDRRGRLSHQAQQKAVVVK